MTEAAPLWTLDRVTLGRGERPRLRDVSVEIPSGVTAVLGFSGAGKTSLLNLLVGFERPDAGRVSSQLPQSDVPVFWAPPDHGLWPQWSVEEHVRRVSRGGSDPQAWLRRFDLEYLASQTPDRLSQGERSRLSLARALASDAPVLVLDEPLVHVDPARHPKYLDVLRQAAAGSLSNQSPRSIVLATHSPELTLALATRVVCLQAGNLAYSGPVQKLYSAPGTSELGWFLGPVNWIGPEDTQNWLDAPLLPLSNPCVRPERLQVTADTQSLLVVESSRFSGSVAELEIRNAAGEVRRFWHRPESYQIVAGTRIRLRVVNADGQW